MSTGTKMSFSEWVGKCGDATKSYETLKRQYQLYLAENGPAETGLNPRMAESERQKKEAAHTKAKATYRRTAINTMRWVERRIGDLAQNNSMLADYLLENEVLNRSTPRSAEQVSSQIISWRSGRCGMRRSTAQKIKKAVKERWPNIIQEYMPEQQQDKPVEPQENRPTTNTDLSSLMQIILQQQQLTTMLLLGQIGGVKKLPLPAGQSDLLEVLQMLNVDK